MAHVIDAARGAESVVSVIGTEHHRVLLSGRTILGVEYVDDRFRWQPSLAAMALLQVVAFLVPAPQRSLCLGLGAGTVPHFLRASGIHTDVVEISQPVIDMAGRHFEFGCDRRVSPGDARVVHADAVQYMAATPKHDKYDVILSDLWSGANAGSTLQLPFLSRLRREWLRPNGTLAINLVAFADGPHASLAIRVVRTLRAAFDHVRCFAEYDTHTDDADADAHRPANLLLIGSDSPIRFDYDSFVRRGHHHYPGVAELMAELASGEGGDAVTPDPRTAFHLHASFQTWQPPRLLEAAAGREGTPLEAPSDWEELASERAAVARGMEAEQRALLSPEAWQLVEDLVTAERGLWQLVEDLESDSEYRHTEGPPPQRKSQTFSRSRSRRRQRQHGGHWSAHDEL